VTSAVVVTVMVKFWVGVGVKVDVGVAVEVDVAVGHHFRGVCVAVKIVVGVTGLPAEGYGR
jgi:hypothetical protein